MAKTAEKKKRAPRKKKGADKPVEGQMLFEVSSLATLFRQMDEEEFQGLKNDIKVSAELREPIMLHQGKVIDGAHRQRAVNELLSEGVAIKVPLPLELPDDDDPLRYVVGKNLNRRHLTASDRAMAAIKVIELARENDESLTQQAAGDMFGVPRITVAMAGRLFSDNEEIAEELRQAVDSRIIPVTSAYHASLEHDVEIQREGVALVIAGKARGIDEACKAVAAARNPEPDEPPDEGADTETDTETGEPAPDAEGTTTETETRTAESADETIYPADAGEETEEAEPPVLACGWAMGQDEGSCPTGDTEMFELAFFMGEDPVILCGTCAEHLYRRLIAKTQESADAAKAEAEAEAEAAAEHAESEETEGDPEDAPTDTATDPDPDPDPDAEAAPEGEPEGEAPPDEG